MNIFLLNKAPTNLASILEDASMTVLTNVSAMPDTNASHFAWNALERVDAIILEISYPADELHYLLAQAIVLQRPTLCLYPKNREPYEITSYLSKPNVPKSVQLKAYTKTNLRDVLHKFLHGIDKTVVLEETPNIKFTLRLTPAMEHYLNWLCRYKKVNKADYLRRVLKQDAEQNEDYQKLL